MPRKAFEALNRQQEEKGGKRFVNPRNAAAGAVRVLDPEITASRRLDFFAYYLLAGRQKRRFAKHSESLWKHCKQLHFNASDDWKLCSAIEAVKKYCDDWEAKREKLPYEIDGIVIKVNRIGVAAGTGFHGQGPALGHRLQISGAAGDDGRERRHLSGGAHGHADAGGCARAGAGRRRHGQPFHAAQHG